MGHCILVFFVLNSRKHFKVYEYVWFMLCMISEMVVITIRSQKYGKIILFLKSHELNFAK